MMFVFGCVDLMCLIMFDHFRKMHFIHHPGKQAGIFLLIGEVCGWVGGENYLANVIRALRTRGTCRFLTRRTLRGGTGHVRDQSFAVGDSAVQASQCPVINEVRMEGGTGTGDGGRGTGTRVDGMDPIGQFMCTEHFPPPGRGREASPRDTKFENRRQHFAVSA